MFLAVPRSILTYLILTRLRCKVGLQVLRVLVKELGLVAQDLLPDELKHVHIAMELLCSAEVETEAIIVWVEILQLGIPTECLAIIELDFLNELSLIDIDDLFLILLA